MKGFPKLKIKGRVYLVLLFILILIFGLDYKVRSDIQNEKVLGIQSSKTGTFEYPVLGKTFKPEISAKGAVVLDADSKVVLYSKNPSLRFSSASTAKIMTALTALEEFNPGDLLTVRDPRTEGVVLGLKSGQKISLDDLLYGLLLPSANDSALTIAQNYGIEKFVVKMNQNAAKFNLYNTHYEDPAGLEDDLDYTTPLDLARLSSIAIKNETFAKIVSTREKTVSDADGNLYQVKNLNKLLGFEDINGIKTGTTMGAGQVLVTSKKEGNHTIIVVVMGSSDRYKDTQKLLDLVSGNITYLPIRL